MPKQRKKRSREEWARLVAEYERGAGGETQEAFSQRQGVEVASFRYWLYKLRGAISEPSVRFVEVTTRADSSGTPGSVEVDLENVRCTVRFGAGADAAFIGDVVATLAQRLEC